MDNSQRADMARQLNARFEPGEHEVRSGGGGKWFVYLKREAIIERLDSIAPMDWQTKIVSTERIADRVEVVMEMTTADVTRSFNGVAEDNRRKAKDGKPEVLFPLMTAKSATTDAFKRVASMFGIGLYLQGCDTIQASNKGDAFKVFERWYHGEGNNNPSPKQQAQSESEVYWNENHIDGLIAYWNKKEGLEVSETLRFAGITEKYNADQWSKYATNQDASAAIQKAFNAELGNNAPDPAFEYDGSGDDVPESPPANGERQEVYTCKFTHMAYVVNGKKYLVFANCDPATHQGDENLTLIRAYGRTTKVKEWLGNDIYDELGLKQYNGAKKTTKFIEMKLPIEFEYVEELTFLKAISIVGADDTKQASEELSPPPPDYDDIPF